MSSSRTSTQRISVPTLLVAALLVVLTACGAAPASPPAPAASAAQSDAAGDHSHGELEAMPHLHGLGFSADGRRLLVPAHTGLRIYEDGAWHTPDAPAHDYMGFAPVDDGFYSSGHPAPRQ